MTDERFDCYVLAGTDARSGWARRLEWTVFYEFFGNTADELDEAYGPYEEHSTFVTVEDREKGSTVGVLRIIKNSEPGLKTLNDIPVTYDEFMQFHGITDLSKCWDIGTLAVRKAYRGTDGQRVSLLLYGLLYAELVRNGIEHVVAIVDDHAYRQLTETLKLPFVHIADSEPFAYMNSPVNHAVYMRVADIVPEQAVPELQALGRGEGLPEVKK